MDVGMTDVRRCARCRFEWCRDGEGMKSLR